MSKEAFLRFRETVVQNAELRSQLVDTVKSQADLVAMGQRLGFEFGVDDLGGEDLTEDDLKLVTGGAGVDLHKIESRVGLETLKWDGMAGFNELLHKVGVTFRKN